MAKDILKRLVISGKTILFLFLVFYTITVLGEILHPTFYLLARWDALYQELPESIDVLFIGSSHSYSSFDPAVFEREWGVKAFNLASNSQNIIQSYYNLKEVLKYQSPQIVVLEAFSFNDNNNYLPQDKDWKKEGNFDGMHFGRTKLEALKGQYLPENYFYAMIPFYRNHSNWKNTDTILHTINSKIKGSIYCKNKGFTPSNSRMTVETKKLYEEMDFNDNEFIIHENQIKHFQMMVELCKTHNIKLIIVMAPMYNEYIKHINYESKYFKIKDIAEKNNLIYIDYNILYDELELDESCFEDAFNSYHHMNQKGAKIVSEDLTKRINLS